MKIFQTIQIKFAFLGFESNLRPINNRQKWIFFEIFFCVTSLCVHLFHVASTPKEYLDSILITGMAILILISHISTILQMATIFTYIDEVEGVLNESKFVLFYSTNYSCYKHFFNT